MNLKINHLYWISYNTDEGIESFTGFLVRETKDTIELERGDILVIPKELIDRIWCVD